MTTKILETPAEAAPCAGARAGLVLRPLVMAIGPILATLAVSGGLLLAFGVDPLEYYRAVLRRGLYSSNGIQETFTRMAPLLLIAASLTVAFRAGIWNLGGDGQFLLAAVSVAAAGPAVVQFVPHWLALILCMIIGAAVGAAWSLLPALLRAYQGVNEIITTLMMTFLGVSLANVLVKLVFLDPSTPVPQTRTLAVEDRLPKLFGTHVSIGVAIGLVVVILVHLVMTRSAFGLKLRVVGANARAATHAGLPVPRLTLTVFAISAALAGLAGAVEILGVEGNARADWNPAFGLTVIPLVFLARFNGYASIAFVFMFSVLSIGGESAARLLGVPNFFTLVVVSVLLMLLALAEYFDHRHGQSARR